MTAALREIKPPPGAPPRLTSRAFPSYRHVPGLHPHPVAHPDGHSHDPTGAHPPAGPLYDPARWRDMEDHLYGVDLYNAGFWWEAHEAWEGLWQQSDKRGVQGRFLQGLIQISAAHLKRHVDQPEGVERLLERARGHLAVPLATLSEGERYMGLDLHAFVSRVNGWFGESSTAFPFIRLEP